MFFLMQTKVVGSTLSGNGDHKTVGKMKSTTYQKSLGIAISENREFG